MYATNICRLISLSFSSKDVLVGFVFCSSIPEYVFSHNKYKYLQFALPFDSALIAILQIPHKL
jgi:hypothetical protein